MAEAHDSLNADKTQENPIRILVCVSDEEHARVAVRFASARLKHRGGKLLLLHVCDTADFQSFSTIASRIREENHAKGQSVLESMAEEVRLWAGAEATLLLREGNIVDEILTALEEHPDINLLVLGASAEGDSKREVLTALSQRLGKRLFVPMLVVPGHLTEQQIWELT